MRLPVHVQHVFILPCLLLLDVCTYVSKGFAPAQLFYCWHYFTTLSGIMVPSSQNEIFSEGSPEVKPHGSSEYYQRWEVTGLHVGLGRPNEKK